MKKKQGSAVYPVLDIFPPMQYPVLVDVTDIRQDMWPDYAL